MEGYLLYSSLAIHPLDGSYCQASFWIYYSTPSIGRFVAFTCPSHTPVTAMLQSLSANLLACRAIAVAQSLVIKLPL